MRRKTYVSFDMYIENKAIELEFGDSWEADAEKFSSFA